MQIKVPWLEQFATPLGVCCAALPTAMVAHAVWSHQPEWVAAMSAASVVVTAYANHSFHRRHETTRRLATWFTGLWCGWVVTATATTPYSGNMLGSLALGSLVLSGAWCLRHHGLAVPHEHDKAAAKADGYSALTENVAALKGSRAKSVTTKGRRVEANVQLTPGEATAEDVQAEAGRIASALAVGASDVSVDKVPGRADQVKVSVQLSDDLLTPTAWEGDLAPGGSVRDAPLRIGVRADGSPVDLWIVGDSRLENPRQLAHTLTTGMTGSGKTETLKTVVVALRWRRDAVPVIGCPAKFGQSFGSIAHSFGLAADGKKQVNSLVNNLPDAIAYRAQLLGRLPRTDGSIGYSEWEPECYTEHGIPLVFVAIEEATDVLEGDNDSFDEAIRKARSVGIAIHASLQVAQYDNISRKTRGQFGNSLAHGCKENMDAKFALSAETREAGADPTKWANDYAGCMYAETVGTPREKWSIDGRAYRLTRDQARNELAASQKAGHWANIDHGTMAILSRGITVPDAKISAMLPDVEPDEVVETETELTLVHTEDGTVDITMPISGEPTRPLALRPEGERPSTEAARRLLEDRIDALETAGTDSLAFDDLADVAGAALRSPAWVYGELNRLVDAGRLEPGTGRPALYRIRQRVGTVPRQANGHRFA